MTFWVDNVHVLIEKDQLQFWTDADKTLNENLNAITRTVILLSAAGFIATFTFKFVWVGIITTLCIVMYQRYKMPETFVQGNTKTKPTAANPFMNVMVGDEPTRSAAREYDPVVKREIMEAVKDNVPEKAYEGLENELKLEGAMLPYNTMPITTIPNDQKGFGEFCYGNMMSRKEGTEEALSRHAPRIGSVG